VPAPRPLSPVLPAAPAPPADAADELEDDLLHAANAPTSISRQRGSIIRRMFDSLGLEKVRGADHRPPG
jgi:hypothetical protein